MGTIINTKCENKYKIETLHVIYFIMSSVVINGHGLSLRRLLQSN